jgi:nucleoside-diphosphate-sugar epimerase
MDVRVLGGEVLPSARLALGVMPRALVTGAGGFVASHLVPVLSAQGWDVRVAVRSASTSIPAGVEQAIVGDLSSLRDLADALAGVDTVVHLAARVHVMRDMAADPDDEFRRANVDATRHLAEQAAMAGVKRVVFLSSVKVNGERTTGRPFSETDAPAPQDAYARSKHAAEAALWEVAAVCGLEVVVIRPPLVYGPGVKANFLSLMGLMARGIPLPFGAVDNRRSLVGIWNLCDLIACCMRHPAAAGETFLVSDQHDLSTPELMRLLAGAMGRPARLLPLPPALLRVAGRLAGRAEMVDRLIGSLQVDASKATDLLGWRPPVSVDDGLARTVRWYLQAASGGA